MWETNEKSDVKRGGLQGAELKVLVITATAPGGLASTMAPYIIALGRWMH